MCATVYMNVYQPRIAVNVVRANTTMEPIAFWKIAAHVWMKMASSDSQVCKSLNANAGQDRFPASVKDLNKRISRNSKWRSFRHKIHCLTKV